MLDLCERPVISSLDEPCRVGETDGSDHVVELLQFQPSARHVSAQRILRIQGYSDPMTVRPAIAQAARMMAVKAVELCHAQLAMRQLGVSGIDSTGVELESVYRLNSPAFEDRLRGCDEVVVFVLSCGSQLDRAVVDFADSGDLLEAVLLESAGWLCLEDATRQFKHLIRDRAATRDKRITSRMGPGYSYPLEDRQVSWPLEDHPNLFDILGGVRLPAALMSSFAMNPKLSRSGLYGIAPLHVSRAGRPGPRN